MRFPLKPKRLNAAQTGARPKRGQRRASADAMPRALLAHCVVAFLKCAIRFLLTEPAAECATDNSLPRHIRFDRATGSAGLARIRLLSAAPGSRPSGLGAECFHRDIWPEAAAPFVPARIVIRSAGFAATRPIRSARQAGGCL